MSIKNKPVLGLVTAVVETLLGDVMPVEEFASEKKDKFTRSIDGYSAVSPS